MDVTTVTKCQLRYNLSPTVTHVFMLFSNKVSGLMPVYDILNIIMCHMSTQAGQLTPWDV